MKFLRLFPAILLLLVFLPQFSQADSISGSVYDSYNLGTVDFCRVEFRNITDGSVIYLAYTNASGYYSIDDFVNETYNLTVRHRDYEVYSQSFAPPGEPAETLDINITSRQTSLNLALESLNANFNSFVAQSYDWMDSVGQEIDFIYHKIQSSLAILSFKY